MTIKAFSSIQELYYTKRMNARIAHLRQKLSKCLWYPA